jgi:hypothetical protein
VTETCSSAKTKLCTLVGNKLELNVLAYFQVRLPSELQLCFGFNFVFSTAFIYEFEQTNIPCIADGGGGGVVLG